MSIIGSHELFFPDSCLLIQLAFGLVITKEFSIICKLAINLQGPVGIRNYKLAVKSPCGSVSRAREKTGFTPVVLPIFSATRAALTS